MSSIEEIWNRVATRVKATIGKHQTLQEDDATSSDAHPRSLSTDYTELMGGSVPCPSCKGTGRIPRELEETLVALIPLNDERLKPKRTWFWVLLGIGISFILTSAAIFMLVPRAVELVPSRRAVDIIHVVSHAPIPDAHVKFHFMNIVNITNANYYSIQVTNTTATIISKFQPWSKDIIGSGMNSTSVSIAPLSHAESTSLFFNNSVTLTGIVAEYCQAPFSRLTSLYVTMQFDVMVTMLYFNHKEQLTLSTQQQVCCVPSGNCTST